jgi:hypothetical protein
MVTAVFADTLETSECRSFAAKNLWTGITFAFVNLNFAVLTAPRANI